MQLKYSPSDSIGQSKLAIAANPAPMLPAGPYRLIVADPPWAFSLRETDATHRGRCGYPPMSPEQIKEIPVASMVADEAYLLLWFTKQHTELAYEVARAWGFIPKNFHTWEKISKTGLPRIMLGHYGRNCEEHYLIASRGKVGSWTHLGIMDVPSLFRAELPSVHSRKPEKFWARANRLKGAIAEKHGDCNAIELFSRQYRSDWDTWGNEAVAA